MSRPKGSTNRPKYISIPLSKLNEVFKENTLIKISIDYASLFSHSDSALDEETNLTDDSVITRESLSSQAIDIKPIPIIKK